MSEWLVEEGIGEERAILLDNGRIIAARLNWPGSLTAGQIEDAVLISRASGAKRGTVRFASGEEALIDRLPAIASEGAPLRCLVTRASLAERGRRKLARAVPTEDALKPALNLLDQLRAEGHEAEKVRSFPEAGWEELWLEAWQGLVTFNGGELILFDTPAMTLIDIDGTGDARVLALVAVRPLTEALARLDVAGNIGIDFPTLQAKADRKTVDAALDEALADWPHERTAMNGFGFVQIVARHARPSLIQRLHHARAEAAVRLLLRRAERVAEAGVLLLTMHPAMEAKLKPEWQAELARRTGRVVRTRTEVRLALEAGFAQAVPI